MIFAYIAAYLKSLSFLLSAKAVVLLIKITFKRIDSAIPKLTLSCLKNIVVWNTYAIKRACDYGIVNSSKTRSAGRRQAVWAPDQTTTRSRVKTVISNIIFFKDQPKSTKELTVVVISREDSRNF